MIYSGVVYENPKPAWKLRGYRKRKLNIEDIIKIWFINILDKYQI